MTIVLLAFLAMLLQDLLAVPLVQAEAAQRAHLAAILDTIGWLVAISVTFISVDALQGHDTTRKVAVIVAVSAANYLGTYSGTKLGARLLRRKNLKKATSAHHTGKETSPPPGDF